MFCLFGYMSLVTSTLRLGCLLSHPVHRINKPFLLEKKKFLVILQKRLFTETFSHTSAVKSLSFIWFFLITCSLSHNESKLKRRRRVSLLSQSNCTQSYSGLSISHFSVFWNTNERGVAGFLGVKNKKNYEVYSPLACSGNSSSSQG